MTPEQQKQLLAALQADLATTKALVDRMAAERERRDTAYFEHGVEEWISISEGRMLDARESGMRSRHEQTINAFLRANQESVTTDRGA